MTAHAANLHPDNLRLRACTLSRDLARFPQLIEQMEFHLGEAWGDIEFRDAQAFLADDMAKDLEFLILAVDREDEADLVKICSLIKLAKAQKLPAIIVGHNLNPVMLHQLMRHGASDFIPYPLPPNGFDLILQRLRNPPLPPCPIEHRPETIELDFIPKNDRSGQLLAAHGLVGGAGATTFITNLAWEMVLCEEAKGKRICLLDLDFQFGTLAQALDLPQGEAVCEFLAKGRKSDAQALVDALQCYNESLYVLTAPAQILPHEVLSARDMSHVLDLALANFDYVLVDMPSTITVWTAEVLRRAKHYFLLLTPEARAQTNLGRFLQALSDEELPTKPLRQVLNRDPDFSAETPIGADFSLPDGGVPVSEALDHGEPLAEGLPKNALRRALRKLAQSLCQDKLKAQVLH